MAKRNLKTPITSKEEAKQHPDMERWVMGGNPDAILAQEARGADSFVTSDTLPTDISNRTEAEAYLKTLGFKFLGPVPNDKLFQYVKFPEGWKRKPDSDDPRHITLLDNKDRKRGYIFYKAAFYDRKASMHLDRRFDFHTDYSPGSSKAKYSQAWVEDYSYTVPKKVFVTEKIERTSDKYWDFDMQVEQLAHEWLIDMFPGSDKFSMYWEYKEVFEPCLCGGRHVINGN